MVTTSPTYQTYTPVEVESVPVFDFPKSVPTNRNIDFSVTLSLVAAADGSARNIKVDEASVDAATGQVFYNLHSTTKDKHIDEIEGELVELVTGKIGGTKFKPRTLNGEALPTMVFVNLRFIAGPNACPNVVAEFKTSAGTISYNTVSNPCKHALL